MKVECTVLLKTALTTVMWIWWILGKKLHNSNIVLTFFWTYMKFRNVVYKLSSGGACQILRLISSGGTQSR